MCIEDRPRGLEGSWYPGDLDLEVSGGCVCVFRGIGALPGGCQGGGTLVG